MIYDCGTLAKHPNRSSIYRYFRQNNTMRTYLWDKGYALEAAIFVQSQISLLWVQRNLGFGYHRVQELIRQFPEAKDVVLTNISSATYDDAVRYMNRAGGHIHPPAWVIPYMLEDIKHGMTKRERLKHWGSTLKLKQDFLKGQADVFYLDVEAD